MNIKETKEVLIFGLMAGKLLRADLADGKMSGLEILGLYTLIGPAKDALLGISLVPLELKELSADESSELVDIVRQFLEQDITDTAALAKAEQVLSSVGSFASALAMLRGIK